MRLSVFWCGDVFLLAWSTLTCTIHSVQTHCKCNPRALEVDDVSHCQNKCWILITILKCWHDQRKESAYKHTRIDTFYSVKSVWFFFCWPSSWTENFWRLINVVCAFVRVLRLKLCMWSIVVSMVSHCSEQVSRKVFSRVQEKARVDRSWPNWIPGLAPNPGLAGISGSPGHVGPKTGLQDVGDRTQKFTHKITILA